jgi:hypothetical protein
MESIQEKLLKKYKPVTLSERDVGKKFIFIHNNWRLVGTFDGFVNSDKNFVYATINGTKQFVGLGEGGFLVFRISDIQKNMWNKIITTLPEDMIYEISRYGGSKKRVKKMKKTRRRSNKYIYKN